MSDTIKVVGAREKNLKNIHVQIPKKKIVLVTGVSGSGKSSLVFDTIAAESQRQLNSTYDSFVQSRLAHYGQPDVDSIEGLPVSFVINQKRIGSNARSTVGTLTDAYALLRLLFSRIGLPFVGYSDVFSFNNPKGMCPRCSGLGRVDDIDVSKILDENQSLETGAILFPGFERNGWRITRYLYCGLFDPNMPIKDYSQEQRDLLLYGDQIKLLNPDPRYPKSGLFEGVIPRIQRSFLKQKSREAKRNALAISDIVTSQVCADCGGGRLNATVLSCQIQDMSIADCCTMSLHELQLFLKGIHSETVEPIRAALDLLLEHFVQIGLGYLNLNRETSSLSGGESQRIKMIKQLGSSLTDVLYVFDEPSVGLHPYNISKVNDLLVLLKEKGNTVLIVEHDPDVIQIADFVIDVGPLAGKYGGAVVYSGDYQGFRNADTLTSRFLSRQIVLNSTPRLFKEVYKLENLNMNNLKNLTVAIPKSVLTLVSGVAGSGKSTLINRELVRYYPEAVVINQERIHVSKRSSIASFTNIFDAIRKLFASENKVSMSWFSANAQGACAECKGLGKIHSDLAFLDDVVTQCEACGGMRYNHEALQFQYHQRSIAEVLSLSIEDALVFFEKDPIAKTLQSLVDVGLSYLTLGQTSDTLSGGELQRCKLARELTKKGNLYVLDEPTTGLHMADISLLMTVLNRIVDAGNTVVVIEHNLDVIACADWVIDLGPGAGDAGGDIVFEGTVVDLLNHPDSLTARYLNQYISKDCCE